MVMFNKNYTPSGVTQKILIIIIYITSGSFEILVQLRS